MSAINEIADERKRQIEKEGWNRDHDDEHDVGSLAVAAAAYALYAAGDASNETLTKLAGGRKVTELTRHHDEGRRLWPWEPEGFKPKGPRQNLIRAAALIVAEIERLDRIESSRLPQSSRLSEDK